MKRLFGLIVLGFVTSSAYAASVTPSGACWEVYQPHNATVYPILLNRCTSDSWVLIKHPVQGHLAGRATSYTYTWDKINMGQASHQFVILHNNLN
jgi:hypothetical protein